MMIPASNIAAVALTSMTQAQGLIQSARYSHTDADKAQMLLSVATALIGLLVENPSEAAHTAAPVAPETPPTFEEPDYGE
jgi:hypothetical protein